MRKSVIAIFLLVLIVGVCQAQTVHQADSLHQQGRELVSEGKVIEGRECTQQAMEIRKKLLGEVSEDYITSLNNYAYSFGAEKNWQKAVELQEQVMVLCGKLKTPHKNIGMYTTNMGRYYYLVGDKVKAAQMWERAIPLVEKYGEIYEFLLNSLGSVYNDTGDQQGISRIMALMEEHNQHELAKPCDEPKCMLERAQYYVTMGNQTKAQECYQTVISMKMDIEMNIKVYEEYARFMAMTVRDRKSGAEYQKMAAMLRKESRGADSDYANSMYYAALYYTLDMTDGSFRNAIECADQAIHAFEGQSKALMVAKCQQLQGNSFGGLKEFGKAKECYAKALVYYETYDKENAEYPKMIERVAAMEKFNREYEASIAHYRQAIALFEQRGMMQEYGNAENGLKLCYAYAGKNMNEASDGHNKDAVKEAERKKLDGIIADEKNNLELTRTYLGKLMYARSLSTIAGCYAMKEDYQEAVNYYQQYMQVVREGIREEFRYENETERMHTWSEEANTITELRELLVLLPDSLLHLRSGIAALMYDAELLSKGILLNSAIEFEKLLSNKNDQQLTATYQQIKANRSEIERLRSKASSDADLEMILKLTQENQRLQMKLNKGFQEMEDFTHYISYNWKDVRSNLNEGDVSLEFTTINLYLGDTPSHMAALVLTKDMLQPEAVIIEEQGSLWSQIANYLQGKKRIFFSAAGVLHNIGIEYLPFGGKPLSEQFEVYRLSSTKELCYRRPRVEPTKAALFGDINYNEEAILTSATHSSPSALRGSGDAGSYGNLDNTLREINDIQEILQGKGIKDVIRFRDIEASKTAFLAMTDSMVNLLHVATHGSYQEVKKATDAESMQNSCLVFAGANLDNRGIVTAAEIAQMNLRQCELVVLSACETGLGKLGDDGVFGLQRGFKNAGVHTLLMSLQRVDDKATSELMVSFYRYLMNGSDKREALVKAQQDLRAKGFTDPKYWAAFILLDGLD